MTPRSLSLQDAITAFERAGMSGNVPRLKGALVDLGRAIEALGPPPPGSDAVRHLVSFPSGHRAYALFCGGAVGGRVEALREQGETTPWSRFLVEIGAPEA